MSRNSLNIPQSYITAALRGGKATGIGLAVSIWCKVNFGDSLVHNFSYNRLKSMGHCHVNNLKKAIESSPHLFSFIKRTNCHGESVKGKNHRPITDLLAKKYKPDNRKPVKLYIYDTGEEFKTVSLIPNLKIDELNKDNSASDIKGYLYLIEQAAIALVACIRHNSDSNNSSNEEKRPEDMSGDDERKKYKHIIRHKMSAEDCRNVLTHDDASKKLEKLNGVLLQSEIKKQNTGNGHHRIENMISSPILKAHTIARRIKSLVKSGVLSSEENVVCVRDFNGSDKIDLSFRPTIRQTSGFGGVKRNKYLALFQMAGYDDAYYADEIAKIQYMHNALNVYDDYGCLMYNLEDDKKAFQGKTMEKDGMWFIRLANIYTSKMNILRKGTGSGSWHSGYRLSRRLSANNQAEKCLSAC